MSWYPEDLDEAYNLLILANESIEGELKDYNANVAMLGAVNRDMVTCYLDALLFAMFARLDSFEAMLYDNFEDEPRKKLAAVLRLWVNLLRTGQLIKVELVRSLRRLHTKTNKCARLNTFRIAWLFVDGKRPRRSANRTLQKPSPSSLAPLNCRSSPSRWTSITQAARIRRMTINSSMRGYWK